MNNFSAEGNFYTISHIVLFTGLSDRTIRNYIAAGFLDGEKINGMWHFTPEQVETFLFHPVVRPTILSKHHSLIYDFLLESDKGEHECCIILNIPDDVKCVSEFFCYTISNGDFKNIRFSLNSFSKTPSVILKGRTTEIMNLVNSYYSRSE